MYRYKINNSNYTSANIYHHSVIISITCSKQLTKSEIGLSLSFINLLNLYMYIVLAVFNHMWSYIYSTEARTNKSYTHRYWPHLDTPAFIYP